LTAPLSLVVQVTSALSLSHVVENVACAAGLQTSSEADSALVQ